MVTSVTQTAVHTALYELPPFWDRSTVFLANLKSLFYGNQAQTDVLRDEVAGMESYGGRLVPILDLLFAAGDNRLVLEVHPVTELMLYQEGELGLSLPPVHISPAPVINGLENGAASQALMREICAHDGSWIDGFVTDPRLLALARQCRKTTVSSVEGSRNGNNKLLLHRHLEAQGLPVFDTRIADEPAMLPGCAASLAAEGYDRIVVKSQIGASGIGIACLDVGAAQPDSVPEYMFHEGPCLVQGWIESDGEQQIIGSPSVQIFIADDAAHLYDVTEQILNDSSVHEGNVSPPPYIDSLPGLLDDLVRAASVSAAWLHDQGYRGTGSVDFLVVRRRSGIVEPIVCEINARVTGATYPSILARRFHPHGAWLMRNVRLRPPSPAADILDALDRGGCLFRPGAVAGVLPINFNPVASGAVGKGQLLCLGASEEAVHDMCRQAEAALQAEWDNVRD